MHKTGIITFFRTYVSKWYTSLTSLCSITGFVALFVKDETACIIALSIFCVCLLGLLYAIYRGINKLILESSEKEYRSISSFYTFECTDGQNSTFEVYRLIQCKRLFLTEISYNFKWSGTKKPTITSNAQNIRNVSHNGDKEKWDDALIQFKRPLRYNECTVVNIKTENDDFDGKAKPWLSCKLESPIEMMVYRILLPYKPSNYNVNAVFERKKIGAQIDGDYDYIGNVPFNSANKQYSYCIVNPEPGYIYRLRWEK